MNRLIRDYVIHDISHLLELDFNKRAEYKFALSKKNIHKVVTQH